MSQPNNNDNFNDGLMQENKVANSNNVVNPTKDDDDSGDKSKVIQNGTTITDNVKIEQSNEIVSMEPQYVATKTESRRVPLKTSESSSPIQNDYKKFKTLERSNPTESKEYNNNNNNKSGKENDANRNVKLFKRQSLRLQHLDLSHPAMQRPESMDTSIMFSFKLDINEKLQLTDTHLAEKEAKLDDKDHKKHIVNDDKKFPQAVTPIKIDKTLSKPGNYDVPFMDDQDFICDGWYMDDEKRWCKVNDEDEETIVVKSVNQLKKIPSQKKSDKPKKPLAQLLCCVGLNKKKKSSNE